MAAAPSMADAARAADALAAADVPMVLLYGSVARGEQNPNSDIDLVAVFDDLDYETRWRCKLRLEALAREAAGWPVEVRVTDRPEWEHRRRRLRTSFEAGIATDAVVLCDRPPGSVNWHKEIGMPSSDLDEAVNSLHNMNQALTSLGNMVEPTDRERRVLDDRDAFSYSAAVARRLREVCSCSQSVLENGLKALVHLRGKEPPRRIHELDTLLSKLPEPLAETAAGPLTDLDLSAASQWRMQGTYPAEYPEVPLEDLVPLAHSLATAACALGRLTAEHIAAAGPTIRPAGPPTAGSADWEAAEAAYECTNVERVLDGWDFTRSTPTARMGIPEPPEEPDPYLPE